MTAFYTHIGQFLCEMKLLKFSVLILCDLHPCVGIGAFCAEEIEEGELVEDVAATTATTTTSTEPQTLPSDVPPSSQDADTVASSSGAVASTSKEAPQAKTEAGTRKITPIVWDAPTSSEHCTFLLHVNYTTVVLEIFAVVDNLRLKETVKISNSEISFEQIFATANIYGLLKPQVDYNRN